MRKYSQALFLASLLLLSPWVMAESCEEYRAEYQCPGTEKYPIHLSFDDGPADVTPGILDLLKQWQAPATFFVIAEKIDCEDVKKRCLSHNKKACRSYQNCLVRINAMQRAINEGHMVGSHSYLHLRHSELSQRKMLTLMTRSKTLLQPYFTTNPPLFRLPFGDGWFNRDKEPQVMEALHELGFKHLAWEMSAYDWKKEDQQGDKILRTVMKEICTKKSGVILFHDGDPDQEHIGRTFTANNLANWLPAMSCVADFKPLDYFHKDIVTINPNQRMTE